MIPEDESLDNTVIPEIEFLYNPHVLCLPVLHRESAVPVPSILYVEDNKMLAQTVRDVLQLAGWRVEYCPSGMLASVTIESAKHFDLLLLDNEIHFVTGLQLTQVARRCAHRRETPIILMSIEDYAEQAHAAGADAFLRKPGNIVELVDTIRRLLSR